MVRVGVHSGLVLAVLVLLAGCSTGPSAGATDTLTPAPPSPEGPVTTGSPMATAVQTTSTEKPNATPERAERTEFQVTVVRVVDGDTVEVRFANGDVEDLRLLGVDTPEVHTETDPLEWEDIPDTQAGRDHLREWGGKASAFASSHLEVGEGVRIVVDSQADRRGSFGRLLVYIYDDGVLFNLVLIEQGYARMYESSFSKRSDFASAETAAQDAAMGVWSFVATSVTPTSTPTASSSTGQLQIVEIHEDAEGNDHENENDEYVAFQNTGDAPLDLTGWRVEDEAGHTYRFTSGFTLDPGAKVVLRTGSGTDTDSSLYWGSDSAIWNNGGDTIFVYNDTGSLVIERSYS